jgi:aryl-alcohol dehydrogenase-like predicted oxidoreductase
MHLRATGLGSRAFFRALTQGIDSRLRRPPRLRIEIRHERSERVVGKRGGHAASVALFTRITVPAVLTTLGTTGLAVSRIGLGLAALGRPGYINVGHASDLGGSTDERSMEVGAHAVLDAAYAAGVRYFDAARSYGRAEAFLASWLRQRGFGPDEVTVGSKWGYTYTADWRVDAPVHEVKDLTVATFRRQVTESRDLLGPNLDLYQIHSATLDSGVLDDSAVREELARLRDSGVAIGLTTTGPKQAETIERALEIGGFDTVQATWNLLERSAGSALAAARREGLGVIVKEALANGRLTERGAIPELADAAAAAGTSQDALAIAAVLAQPWADVVLSGAGTVGQLSSNLAAAALEPDPELLGRFDAIREEPDAYWQTRAALPWN